MPDGLRRLLLAIAARLPQLFRDATSVRIEPNSNGWPVWTLADAIGIADQITTIMFSTQVISIPPVRTFTCNTNPNVLFTTCAENLGPFLTLLVQAGKQYLANGDRNALRSLVTTLRNWADANALRTYPGYDPANPAQSNTTIKYQLDASISLELAVTWGLIRSDPDVSASDRDAIDRWAGELIAFSSSPYDKQADLSPNNQRYLHESVRMAWAIVTRDDATFAKGIARYYGALYQMNPDGSLPWEVNRGTCALRYQSTALRNLIAIAELAASQGYDLYSLEVKGVSIHTAIRFLLDATENQSLVEQYSGGGGACNRPSGPQDLDGLQVPASNNNFGSAYFEAYVARFPDSDLARRMRSYVLPAGLAGARPVYNPESGGDTTCLFAVEPFLNRTRQIGVGQSVRSSNGRYRLTLEPSGNLFLYDDSLKLALWTKGSPSTPGRLALQSDGNLVLSDAQGAVRWASNTSGNPGAYFVVQDDGNLVIYRLNGPASWDRYGSD